MKIQDVDIISGNCAKYFVQKQIHEKLEARIAEGKFTTIVDMGCGDASKWRWLKNQDWSKHFRFVGFDLDAGAIRTARTAFPEWTFIASPAYTMRSIVQAADIVVSFSALEHVYKRRDFIRAARSIMTENSQFYLNYDNGHFLSNSEWKGNLFGPILARFGIERYYQAFVWQDEIEAMLTEFELEVVNELNFHQATNKSFIKAFNGSASTKAYMDAWLEYELRINSLLQSSPQVRKEADSNKFHLSKLFVLSVGDVKTGIAARP